MGLKSLPIIDWELGIRLAGNKQDLAREILQLFIDSLPRDLSEIRELYAEQNYNKLHHQVHKMHSALCYCGLPRLKNIISDLETHLKNNIMTNLPYLLHQLDIEVKLLLNYYSRLTS